VMEAEKDMQYRPSQPGLLGSKLQSTSPLFVTLKALALILAAWFQI
jgi:hypothetical protein